MVSLGQRELEEEAEKERREAEQIPCIPNKERNIPDPSKQRHLRARDENVGPGCDRSGWKRQAGASRKCVIRYLHVCLRPPPHGLVK